MLREGPPYYLINGVSVMCDHEQPDQFYFAPLAPQFVMRREGEVDVPQFSLLEYRGGQKTGGFADFDVDLGLSGEAFSALESELMRLAHLRDRPKLSPIPVVSGSVELMLFGATNAPPPSAGGSGASSPTGAADPPLSGPGFVRRMVGSAKPALYNTNRAAFSVELDQDGVSLLQQAILGELSPISVRYVVDYLAICPAYHIKLHMAWDRVQDMLDDTYGHEGLFTDIQIKDTVDKLVERRAIEFEVDTFVPEDEGGTLLERRDAALARARDMITDAFFESSLSPLRQAPDGWDKAAGLIKSFAPQRFQPFGVFTYKKTHYSRIDNKRLDVDLSERTTVKRTIYPQGHLGGLFRVLEQGVDRSRFITRVTLDNPWFKRRRVRVISHANFDTDPVRSIQAFLTYGGVTRSVLLDKAKPEQDVEWPSTVRDGKMIEPVSLRFDVNLAPAEGGERPHRLSSAVTEVSGEAAELEPRDLFSLESIPILTPTRFPFDRYPTVVVQLAYDDPAHGIRQLDSLRLTREQPNATWQRFLLGAPSEPPTYKLTYRAADGRDRETPWSPLLTPQLDVLDPAPQRLRVNVVSALDFGQVERAFVDLAYDDDEADIHVEDSIEIAIDQPPRPFVVDRVNPDVDRVRYKVTLLMKDTTVFEGPWSTTLGARIFVGSNLKGHRAVTLRAPRDFAARGLESIAIQARAKDDVAGLSFADSFVLRAPGASATFEFDFADPARDAYELQIKRLFKNGMSASQDWQRFDQDELTLAAT